MDLRCQLLDTLSSVGVGARAEDLAGVRVFRRCIHQAPVHTGTVCGDVSLFKCKFSDLLGLWLPLVICFMIYILVQAHHGAQVS